jgi:uncharacterized membrane protein (UPF0127 family)
MKALGIALILLSLVLAGCGGETGSSRSANTTPDSRPQTTTSDSELRTVTIDASGGEKVEIRVEIADTDAERAQGLMDRTALGDNRGMLFVFEEEKQLSFWMKNTLIPLAVAFMDSEGRVVDIQDMKPLDDDPPHYVSAKPAQYALEVNKGFFEERGIEVGDRAELPV